jgi:hypothetical protein
MLPIKGACVAVASAGACRWIGQKAANQLTVGGWVRSSSSACLASRREATTGLVLRWVVIMCLARSEADAGRERWYGFYHHA